MFGLVQLIRLIRGTVTEVGSISFIWLVVSHFLDSSKGSTLQLGHIRFFNVKSLRILSAFTFFILRSYGGVVFSILTFSVFSNH